MSADDDRFPITLEMAGHLIRSDDGTYLTLSARAEDSAVQIGLTPELGSGDTRFATFTGENLDNLRTAVTDVIRQE